MFGRKVSNSSDTLALGWEHMAGLRTRLLMVAAPIVLMSWTTSSMRKTTTSSEGILAALREKERSIDRRVSGGVWKSSLASSGWLGQSGGPGSSKSVERVDETESV